eukprot:2475567-Karenia_brevis.AAC.1
MRHDDDHGGNAGSSGGDGGWRQMARVSLRGGVGRRVRATKNRKSIAISPQGSRAVHCTLRPVTP